MNSEELELSLRAEFENYLKDVVAGMQQDVVDFQKNFEAEFEKHKSQMDDAFRSLSARFGSDLKFDQAFIESVVEHLRLARDDGAQLTAQAFSEAQKLTDATAPPANYDQLRDAINEISGQPSQSGILRSLVDQVSHFTPRAAFFIVKHDGFVCWRRFDAASGTDDDSVREINFPLSADTLLAESIRTSSTKDGRSSSHSDDAAYLDPLGFGRPERMYAVPLIARGRGVAVLYVDGGPDNAPVNLEAVESLVRVAGLTVELRAASVAVAAKPSVAEAPAHVAVEEPSHEEVRESSTADEVETSTADVETVEDSSEFEYSGEVSVEQTEAYVAESVSHVDEAVSHVDEAVSHVEAAAEEVEESSYSDHVAVVDAVEEAAPEADYEAVEIAEPVAETPTVDSGYMSSDSYAPSTEPEPVPVEEYAYAGEPANTTNGHSYEPAPEPVVEVATVQPVASRLSDRNVDLPIEVSDDERRQHNDARRFARLLVSEIKLYNEQKVNEGRHTGDLYDRLREAIDRSREMYDKRVKPEVAAKFDYFHYELVSNLAEGNDAKLGASYPGASV